MSVLVPERREAILAYLKENHSVSVEELSRRMFISPTSIRRDLAYLESKGLVRKTYGGAILISGENEMLSLDARSATEKEAKNIIAQKAVSLIQDGDVIFLDSSSTVLAMVPYIRDMASLTVITNGAKAALSLVELPFVRVYCTGGKLKPRVYSYTGPLALSAVSELHADKLFVSPKALDSALGAYCTSEDEASIRKAMMEHSCMTILLCASKKLDQRAAFRLCPMNAIHTIVLDEQPDARWQACFASNGVRIL